MKAQADREKSEDDYELMSEMMGGWRLRRIMLKWGSWGLDIDPNEPQAPYAQVIEMLRDNFTHLIDNISKQVLNLKQMFKVVFDFSMSWRNYEFRK